MVYHEIQSRSADESATIHSVLIVVMVENWMSWGIPCDYFKYYLNLHFHHNLYCFYYKSMLLHSIFSNNLKWYTFPSFLIDAKNLS
jgi:hypothetical protein